MTSRKPDIPGLTLADWQAYRAGTLSEEGVRRVEELLLNHPFEADAAEGWDALGADRAAAITDALNRDIAVLSQNEGHAVVPGLAPRHAGKGRVRRMNPARWAAAAVVMGFMVGGLWFLTRVLNAPGDATALDRNDARQEEVVKPGGATEALPWSADDSEDELSEKAEEATSKPEAADKAANNADAVQNGRGSAASAEDLEEVQRNGKGPSAAPPALAETAPAASERDYYTEPITDEDMALEETLETEQADVALFDTPAEPALSFDQNGVEKEAASVRDEKNLKLDDDLIGQPAQGYAAEALSQQVHGKIVDANTGEPLIGATITVPGTQTGTTADIEGRFTLDLPPGSHTFQAQYIGFESFTDSLTLAAGATQQVELALEPASLALDAVTITQASSSQDNVRTLSSLESKGGKRRKRDEQANTKSVQPAEMAAAEAETINNPAPQWNSPAAAALLLEAEGALDSGDPYRALGILSAISLRPAGENTESDQARVLHARAHLGNGSPALVPGMVGIMADMPANAQYDPARFYLAEARFQMGETEAARILWRALAYENGDWAARARTRLEDTGE